MWKAEAGRAACIRSQRDRGLSLGRRDPPTVKGAAISKCARVEVGQVGGRAGGESARAIVQKE